jgi:hypothetical protein
MFKKSPYELSNPQTFYADMDDARTPTHTLDTLPLPVNPNNRRGDAVAMVNKPFLSV